MLFSPPQVILGIETSCDDTCAAIVEAGHHIQANIIASQYDLQKRFGGIVPEVTARSHLQKISQVVSLCLEEAHKTWNDLQGIAVTHRPGLASSLMIGVAYAKTLALALHLPFIGIHHIEGHVYSCFLENPHLPFPHLCLTVSGGHTLLVLVESGFRYTIVGQTTDDAAGEAFDKTARLLGLGFPGGPALSKLASQNTGNPILFPCPMRHSGDANFSFSGIKTAVRYYVESLTPEQKMQQLPAIADGFQQAVVSALVEKTYYIAQKLHVTTIVLSGGVASNSYLRQQMSIKMLSCHGEVYYPSPILCTDNAAMIAGLAYYKFQQGETSNLQLGIQANAAWKMQSIL